MRGVNALDTVRRRMQLAGTNYQSTLDAFQTIVRKEGPRGLYKGITPKTVAGLPEGKHLLVIRKPGYVRQTLEVRSDPTELTTYSFDMEPSRKKPVWDQLRVTLEEEVLARRSEGG